MFKLKKKKRLISYKPQIFFFLLVDLFVLKPDKLK